MREKLQGKWKTIKITSTNFFGFFILAESILFEPGPIMN